MTVAPHCNRIAAPSVLLVLLAGLIGGAGTAAAAGLPGGFTLEGLGNALAVALETSVVEEVLFRGVVLWGLISWWGSDRTKQAVVVSSLLFGILHLAPDGPLVSDQAWSAAQASGIPWLILATQAVLKVTQATLFGVIMAQLVVRSPWFQAVGWLRARSLAAPLGLHFAFDVLYLGIPLCAGLSLPDSYLTGSMADIVTVTVTTLLLAAALRFSCRQGMHCGQAGGSC